VAARAEVARRGGPCLLVVAVSEPPPPQWSEFEDWVREPLRQAEVLVRATTVARRADVLGAPRLDLLGRLSFRSRTVALSDSQARVVGRLLECPGEVVADQEIIELFAAGGASTHAEALKTAVRRIKDTLAPLGLRVTRVRSAGYLVDRSP
jgi:DNA-binding response OmpR family regulator